ncbi:MAG TPA: RHS repeat-associated core domain-containing protein [Pyrinomonadaceae bacterium]|nr:hypothetical protein [Chloracidobacterium sp.]HRJ87051.1 RHS repeat-associated core domain-containing protein [Pyrinomonadaceae bacterium]HRK51544.1 RHS repeat-associated core domain-containing protein [Pyrinomonadaceae bacterium]
MYQNKHGRFTAPDPLLASASAANPQTFNRYVYVINNPIILVDPDGLQVSFVPSGGTPLVPNGRWYKPIFPDGVQTYRFEASQPDGYEPVTQRNRNGDLIGEYVGGLVGGIPYYVLRFNEMGPMTPLPLLDARTGQRSMARLTDSELNGFDVIPGPEFKHTGAVQNAIEPFDVALLGNPFRFIGSRALSGTQRTSTTLLDSTVSTRSVVVTPKGLDIVKNHLARFGDDAGNSGMVRRLEDAIKSSGGRVTGADRNFYVHELKESTLFRRNLFTSDEAHKIALRWDNANPFSLYHRDVIRANPRIFNPNFMQYWDRQIQR